MKKCGKCKKWLSDDEFHVRATQCKACKKAYRRGYYIKHRDRELAANRAAYAANREHHLERMRSYRKTDGYREVKRNWKRRNSKVSGAYREFHRAIRAGEIEKKPCEVCGSSESEAHHDDYGKPLDVRWMCKKHHLLEHGRNHYGQDDGRNC